MSNGNLSTTDAAILEALGVQGENRDWLYSELDDIFETIRGTAGVLDVYVFNEVGRDRDLAGAMRTIAHSMDRATLLLRLWQNSQRTPPEEQDQKEEVAA